ncbi:MAG: hypothetical protein JSV97_09795 [candidate division WOR-3 bacterium]|nr:MAG: hypothetical protein JSV97_09795 [candidate division WOR-3 bacterium]
MKRFMILLLFTPLLFGIKQVPRGEKADVDKEPSTVIEVMQRDVFSQGKENDKNVKQKDIFIDSDSNSINDRREDDFQKIKELKKPKIKDLLKKRTDEKKEKAITPPREREKKSSKKKSK